MAAAGSRKPVLARGYLAGAIFSRCDGMITLILYAPSDGGAGTKNRKFAKCCNQQTDPEMFYTLGLCFRQSSLHSRFIDTFCEKKRKATLQPHLGHMTVKGIPTNEQPTCTSETLHTSSIEFRRLNLKFADKVPASGEQFVLDGG